MRYKKLHEPKSESQTADGVAILHSRRAVLAAIALSPLASRAQVPCPPATLSVDGAAPPPSPACGSVSNKTLRNASNTGLRGAGISEGSLSNQGSITYNSNYNGQTISGKRFTNTVTLSGSNITIRGCLFEVSPGANQNALVITGGSGNLIEDCTFRPSGETGSIYNQVLPRGGSFTIRRCDISRGENNISFNGGDGMIVEDSFVHDSSNASNRSGHRDCVEIYGGRNMIFRRSTFLHPGGETAVFNIAPWYGGTSVSGVTIEDCYLDGGGSGTILHDLQSTGTIQYVRVRNCFFGGHTNDGSMFYQYWNLNDYDNSPIVTTEAELQSNPKAILWVGNTYLYTRDSPFGYYNQATNRDGETARAGRG